MNMTNATAAPKKLKMPHVLAFLFLMVLVMTAFTWIIPAGEYDRETVKTELGTQSRVVPGSYHAVPPVPQQVWKVAPALVKGFQDSASMIFMVLFCGAAIAILERTGTVHALFQRFIRKMRGREHLAIFAVMLLMSMGGAVGAFANNVLALMPLAVLLARGLGYDSVVGFGMIYLGAFAGFNVGWGNVFTVGIAQNVAQIPQFSGLGVRVLFHAVNLLLTYAFVALYAGRIKRNPAKSLLYEEGLPLSEVVGSTEEDAKLQPLSWRQLCCALITVTGFGSIVWGSVSWGWGVPDYSAVFLGMALLIGLVGGLGVNGTADAFVKGCATLIIGAFVIGISRAISVVMADGKIIDTVVHCLSEPIAHYGPIVGANLMFYANTLINFFINSGSGQAVVVMPLMVPLADLAGITRQVAVQAFQFGDGFSNCIYPTSGILMSALALAGIPYQKYLKWFLPLILLQTVLASAALTVLQAADWN